MCSEVGGSADGWRFEFLKRVYISLTLSHSGVGKRAALRGLKYRNFMLH